MYKSIFLLLSILKIKSINACINLFISFIRIIKVSLYALQIYFDIQDSRNYEYIY